MPGTCDVIRPPLIEMEPDTKVACHLYPAPGATDSAGSTPVEETHEQ